MKNKKKKTEFIDDGRTIAPINIEGMRYNLLPRAPFLKNDKSATWEVVQQPKKPKEKINLTKKEQKAITRSAFLVSLVFALIFVGILFVCFWLLKIFWLKA